MAVSSVQPNWLELPRDVTANILQRLGAIEILASACQVCPLWWNIFKDPHMWHTVHITNFRYSPCSPYNYGDNLTKICRNAVARSCVLVIYDACNFRCVRGLSHEGFSETLRKLPLLEELEISQNKQLSNDSLEIVGQCCPLLKSLKYCRHPLDNIEMNDAAFGIAKIMPGLHYLKMSLDELTNDDVLAILDGCPLLETLDLRACKYVEKMPGTN
ncbi:putative F-box domain, leucine-rich repeat domain, L domain-containing protein [Medicago truncatula]|uniref:Putative F-box domain, leucine-rich repeat domain, L domain-containing protein n=1 Tax=Medicago truncatula TaxID=3880 RepID=A0A396GJE2_MEDTR|nr:putative F-box domain, leucine-rich repeat domain, L domain-containing protein [Medicago truncatula]